jgi:hypothetical protein
MTITILTCPKCGTTVMGNESHATAPAMLAAHARTCTGTLRRVAKVGRRAKNSLKLKGLPLEAAEFKQGLVETAVETAMSRGVDAVLGALGFGPKKR